MIFHMRSGHAEQFEELTKLYRDANLKIGQNTLGRLTRNDGRYRRLPRPGADDVPKG